MRPSSPSSARFFPCGITSPDPRDGPSQVLPFVCDKQTISLSQDLKGLRRLALLVPVEGDLRLRRKLGSEAGLLGWLYREARCLNKMLFDNQMLHYYRH